jgi:hypothetical protein
LVFSEFSTLVEVLEQDEKLAMRKVEEAIERKLFNGFTNGFNAVTVTVYSKVQIPNRNSYSSSDTIC